MIVIALPQVRLLGAVDYQTTLENMRAFTDARTLVTPDEYWVLEHLPTFTLGQRGRIEHVLDAGDIPVVATDRGGQVTYHGPGQLVVYLLLDLRRAGLNVRTLVCGIEQALIELLADYNVIGSRQDGAPGVYVGAAKVAALGLRVRKGRSFHGLALNIDMDLEPFGRINPCGFSGLEVTDLRRLGVKAPATEIATRLVANLHGAFGFAESGNSGEGVMKSIDGLQGR